MRFLTVIRSGQTRYIRLFDRCRNFSFNAPTAHWNRDRAISLLSTASRCPILLLLSAGFTVSFHRSLRLSEAGRRESPKSCHGTTPLPDRCRAADSRVQLTSVAQPCGIARPALSNFDVVNVFLTPAPSGAKFAAVPIILCKQGIPPRRRNPALENEREMT